MSGITNLNEILAHMDPILKEGEYVFCTFASLTAEQLETLRPICLFEEEEGKSIIIHRNIADCNNISYDSIYKLITLRVNSSLESVGLTAAVSSVLTELDISANVVAAFYHDHIFVPADRAREALKAIKSLVNKSVFEHELP